VSRIQARLASLLILAAVVAACTAASGAFGEAGGGSGLTVAYPDGCAAVGLSARRCRGTVESLAAEHGLDLAVVRGVELVHSAGCGSGCLEGLPAALTVRFLLPGGGAIEDSPHCGGIGGLNDIECTDSPEIVVSSVMSGGYHDIPCGGGTPEECASPVPTPEPAAARQAIPLRVAALDVPLDHVGAYRVALGEATLPNGVLTDASFTLADLQPSDFLVTRDGVFLDVVSLDGGGTVTNAYGHGWRPGVERVEAVLTFTVIDADPGAVLRVRAVAVG
jgi:hypothetical protein